ncbi:MAG TPA: hypothetical protein VG754_12300 [Verrucomicrobiae bacterium]|nr:hypothetical protein [Verrucomicrobiae bacterium]
MSTAALTTPMDEPVDLAGGVSKRIMRIFRAQVEDWCDVCRQVSGWEERHFIDALTPEKFKEHAHILDELESVGRWLSLATQSEDFPDRSTADLVSMTLQDLKDRRALWHGKLKPQEREKILRDIFNES